MYSLILENNITDDKKNLKFVLFDHFFSMMKIFFKKYSVEKVPLENFIASKILKKIVPLIDLLKNSFPNEVECLIDLTFSMLDQLCVCYPELFESDYFKTVVKDFFEIEPFKNLYTISKLVTEDNLKLNNYFLEFLTNIFTRNFDNMMKIYSEETSTVNTNHEIFLGIIELFIKYFDHFNESSSDNHFLEFKMLINSKIEENFLSEISQILTLIKHDDDLIFMTFPSIQKLSSDKKKLQAVRAKEAYLLLKLYNITIHNTFKLNQVKVDNLKKIQELALGSAISNEYMKLFTEIDFLYANNVILKRLDINKSQYFILMEKAFPISDKEIK